MPSRLPRSCRRRRRDIRVPAPHGRARRPERRCVDAPSGRAHAAVAPPVSPGGAAAPPAGPTACPAPARAPRPAGGLASGCDRRRPGRTSASRRRAAPASPRRGPRPHGPGVAGPAPSRRRRSGGHARRRGSRTVRRRTRSAVRRTRRSAAPATRSATRSESRAAGRAGSMPRDRGRRPRDRASGSRHSAGGGRPGARFHATDTPATRVQQLRVSSVKSARPPRGASPPSRCRTTRRGRAR
jgi:hypothetical protein